MAGIEWAAGFFDGEGCIRCRVYRGKVNAKHASIHLSISQAEDELLYRFREIFGEVGSINGPYDNDHKGVYHLVISGDNAVKVMELMYPHLGTRKRLDFDRAMSKKKKFDQEKYGVFNEL